MLDTLRSESVKSLDMCNNLQLEVFKLALAWW